MILHGEISQITVGGGFPRNLQLIDISVWFARRGMNCFAVCLALYGAHADATEFRSHSSGQRECTMLAPHADLPAIEAGIYARARFIKSGNLNSVPKCVGSFVELVEGMCPVSACPLTSPAQWMTRSSYRPRQSGIGCFGYNSSMIVS